MSTHIRSLAAAAFVILPACQGTPSSPPVSNMVIGVIDAGEIVDSALSGPTNGAVGEPLVFSITTFGGGCYRPAGAQVINQGLQMTVIPYDSVLPGPCTRDLRALPREVVIVFDRSGNAVLRLQGRSYTGRSPVVVTRQMQIRP